MLRSAKAKTMECYEVIYNLILTPTFRNILSHSINQISTFCYIPEISITIKKYIIIYQTLYQRITLLVNNHFYNYVLTHSLTVTPFDASGKQPFENTVGKGEIARNEQFLLFPVFSTCLRYLSSIFVELEIVVCKLFQFGRV